MLFNLISKRAISQKILFFGSDEFSVASLELLNASNREVQVVVPPVSKWNAESAICFEYAKTNGLKVHQAPPKTLDNFRIPGKFDISVVVSFGYFIPRTILRQFRCNLNVHPSLLPKYRGASPIQYTILNGDRETGTSVIELSPIAFDSGRILRQTRFPIPENLFYNDLLDIVKKDGAENLMHVLDDLDTHMENAIVQNEDHVTKAPKIMKSMAKLDFSKPVKETYCIYRAIGAKIPIYSFFRNKRVQLMEILDPSKYQIAKDDSKCGTLRLKDSILFVRCFDGWLPVTSLKVHGKKQVSAFDFQNGYQLTLNDSFSAE